MHKFNVINYDVNARKFKAYDVLPYLENTYKAIDETYKKRPETFKEFKKFVKDESMYQFWARCEYEIILVDWPCQKDQEKWDVYYQIMMNIDIVTRLLMENLGVQRVPE